MNASAVFQSVSQVLIQGISFNYLDSTFHASNPE